MELKVKMDGMPWPLQKQNSYKFRIFKKSLQSKEWLSRKVDKSKLLEKNNVFFRLG